MYALYWTEKEQLGLKGEQPSLPGNYLATGLILLLSVRLALRMKVLFANLKEATHSSGKGKPKMRTGFTVLVLPFVLFFSDSSLIFPLA